VLLHLFQIGGEPWVRIVAGNEQERLEGLVSTRCRWLVGSRERFRRARDRRSLGFSLKTLEAYELREGQWSLLVTLKDQDPVCVAPFDAIEFSLADLWP
jgi:hypothetical protein